jgi:hypothetical protein
VWKLPVLLITMGMIWTCNIFFCCVSSWHVWVVRICRVCW